MINVIRVWVKASRPRTLPLAFAAMSMAAFLAYFYGYFRWEIYALSLLTTYLLQILSNLANDYGDFVHGADNEQRKGPMRMVQSGLIKAHHMKKGMYWVAFMALGSGLWLLYVALGSRKEVFIFFMALGILAIFAAVAYTASKRPYGYRGLGDLMVFIFFGWVAVLGGSYLYTHTFSWELLLPASSFGLLATAVLNINNIRDLESDKAAGKRTVAVGLGEQKAKAYHVVLLGLALVFATLYHLLNFHHVYQFVFWLVLPLFIQNVRAVYNKRSFALNPYLKQMVVSSLIFVMFFGLGLWLSI